MRKIKEVKVVMNCPTNEQMRAIHITMGKSRFKQIKSSLDKIDCSAGEKEEILDYVVKEMKTRKQRIRK